MLQLLKGIRGKLIVIYLFFGLIPLLVISYHSFHSASSSLERLSNRQLSNLASKTAHQSQQTFREIRKDIDLLSNYPFIQLAFLQFSFGQNLETVRSKLMRYKSQNNLYTRISLVALDGSLVLTVPDESDQLIGSYLDRNRIEQAAREDAFYSGVLSDHPEGPLMILSRRVYDFENTGDPVGLLVFYIRLSSLTRYVNELELTTDTCGFIYDRTLNRFLQDNPVPLDLTHILEAPTPAGAVSIESTQGFTLFSTHLPELNWTVGLTLPEQTLFKDTVTLKKKSLSFALFIGVLAMLTTLFFVRRITDPIAKLTQGAKAFSKGDLDHRIEIQGEGELCRLGEEFNAMASQIKAREKQIRTVDRLASLGILAAGVAHEVRNPLAGIKSCAQLLQRKAISAEVVTLAGGINEEIDRLDKIVRDLLNFARPKDPTRAMVQLEQGIEKALEMTSKSLQKKGIRIIRNFSPTPPVYVDADQVQQIFLNLILNAAQAMKDGGVLQLELSLEEMRVKAAVGDTGCGIPEEHINHIFDPFFTLNPSGTGMGLSVVHSLMQENGIDWNVDSTPNRGTVFHLYFPLERD